MIGSFVTGSLALVLGYAYPAYECFKTVELNKPDIDQLLFWCQYWILIAVLTVFERVGDNFVSWLPMYGEVKLAFFVYLWCPKTKGTAYIYETFFRPYVAKHENEIDRNLLELKTRAGDFLILYFQKVASFGQTRFFEILQYVTSQSPSQSSRNHPVQPLTLQHQQKRSQQTRRTLPTDEQNKQPRSVASSPIRSQQQEPMKEVTVNVSETSSSQPNPIAHSTGQKETSQVPVINNTTDKGKAKEASQVAVTKVTDTEKTKETPIDEAIPVTRARLRKRTASAGASAR